MSVKYWQNFLIDNKVVSYIIEYLKNNFLDREEIYEIWPWKWIISRYLKFYFKKIYLFEIDKNLEKYRNWIDNRYIVYWWDFLKQDLNFLTWKEYFIWNLPYYITSPIFRKINWLFEKWIFMVQKEVADKIKTNASKKNYLWWILNYYYDVIYLKTIDPNSFFPKPKVKSALVYLKKKQNKIDLDYNNFLKTIDFLSWFKRKTIWKILKIKNIDIKNFNENLLKKRLEELNYVDILELYRQIWK